MDWILPFILGWWGSHWWPGIEVDAPKPGGGDPWGPWIGGIVGGLSAILLIRLIGASSDLLVGAVASIAAGAVGSRIVGGVLGQIRSK